ncbi:caspase family protein [Dactylosporangium darangshiense]|uniref:Peptidase C14 caspase domain-containing protein n=1 Tax=Dactylosporangium darangshiense TaxID=579108 RepID=A0ABP8CZ51_9ACTN
MHDAHYAVVVGINRYPGLSDLNGPVHDAAGFVEWLVDPSGGAVPQENVRLVPASPDDDADLTTDEARPDPRNINSALHQLNTIVQRRTAAQPDVWPRTRLYFFVAGHGLLPTDGDAALLAANASSEEPGYNLDLRLYQQWYRRSGCFHELVLFADCCRNDFPGAPSSPPPFVQSSTVDREVRVAIGYATRFGRRAYEDVIPGDEHDDTPPDQRRGFFTTALLRGLRQHRRWDQLRAFVDRTLPDLAESSRRVQHADWYGDDDMLFGREDADRAPATYEVTINFPAGTPAVVELFDDRLAVIDSWDTTRGPWRRALPPGLYGVRGHCGGPVVGRLFQVAGADIDVKL